LHASLDQVLGIVEHQQQLFRAEIFTERLDHGPHRLLFDFQLLRHGLRHKQRI
jgi:hypothetical protein